MLVVDDDADMRALVRLRLAARGYEVTCAESGEAALAALAAPGHPAPDLMLVDVSMPGMDGLAVLEEVRRQDREPAVVMMTAHGSEGVAITALRRGADDYLRKPFDREEFWAVIERTTERLDLRRQNALLRRQLDERRRQLEAELAQAARVQADLLPDRAPRVPGFTLAARCLPAREVGGDFYDWQEKAHGAVTLALGDVMGKGMPAALLMSTVRAGLRAVALHSPPGDAVRAAAAALEPDLDRSNSYVTLFHAQLEPSTGDLTFVDAGHGHVLLHRADGSYEELAPRGLPLGLCAPSLHAPPHAQGRVCLGPGDALVVYSDGLIDARPDLVLDRAAIASRLAGARSAGEMVDRLVTLADLGGPPPDDLSVLIVQRDGAGGAGGER